MRTAHIVASIVFMTLSAYVMWEAVGLGVYSKLGPGAGFFPFYLGLLLGGLSLALMLMNVFPFERAQAEEAGETLSIPRPAMLRIGAILLGVVFVMVAADWLGFSLTMLVMLVFVMTVLDRSRPVLTAAVAIAGSFGCFFLFRDLLQVNLPVSRIAFLAQFGI